MIAPFLAFLMSSQDMAPSDPVAALPPRAESLGSRNFVVSQPRLRTTGDLVRVEGTICRRANRSLISPSRLRIDHLSASGEVVDTQYAYAPRLSQREDQRCGRYGAVIKSPLAPGDVVRVCLPRSGGGCAGAE